MASNDIRINLNVTGEQKAERALKNTGTAAKKAGDDLEGMGKDAGFLTKQVVATSASLQELITQLDRTGDTSLEKGIRQAERDLRKWQRLAKQMTPDAGAAGAGGGITDAAGAAFTVAPPHLKAAGAALAAGTAPFLGAAISAAVLGGVGAGGIIGGIALAAEDPEVKAAGSDLAEALASGFRSAAEPFTAPLVDSLNQLKGTGLNAAGTLAPGLAKLAGTVDALSDGVDGLVGNALPGFSKALNAAVPLVRVAAEELPEVGAAIGDFFSAVSEDPDGSILALKQIFMFAEDGVRAAGDLVAGLSQVYEQGVRAGAVISGGLEDVWGWVPLLGDHLRGTNDDFEGMLSTLDRVKTTSEDLGVTTDKLTVHTFGLGVAADGTADSLLRERDAMKELVDLEIQRIRGTISIERALDNLAEARKENGTSLNVETEAGRRNTEEILANIEAVQRNAEVEYQLAIQHGATAEEAERAARAYREKWGASVAEQTTRLYGNTAAVRALLDELKKLDGRRFTYTVIQQGGRTVGFQGGGGIQLAGDSPVYRRASGGPVKEGPSYWVGENGPELVTFGANGYVHTAAKSQAMVTAGEAGAQRLQVELTVKAAPGVNADLANAIISMLQFECRTTANGSAEELIGTGRA